VASLLAASGKNLPSALRLHASAKSVLLMAAALMWLIRSLRQRSFSSSRANWRWIRTTPGQRRAPRRQTKLQVYASTAAGSRNHQDIPLALTQEERGVAPQGRPLVEPGGSVRLSRRRLHVLVEPTDRAAPRQVGRGLVVAFRRRVAVEPMDRVRIDVALVRNVRCR